MTGTNVVVVGDDEAGRALEAALRDRGFEARFRPTDGLAATLTEIEAEFEAHRPEAAVAAGSGEGALALAITATKLGVPLATLRVAAPAGDEADQSRILATLAALDAGADPVRAAELIAAWLE